MPHRYWPLFDLRLASPELTLRPMTEADLTAICDLLPEDVEQDPAAATYAIAEERISRGIVTHQGYWKAYGTWEPGAWRLNFVVRAAGEILGVQELEGNDFLTLRTVDTSSFLVRPAGPRPRLRQADAGRGTRAGLRALASAGGHYLSMA
jgi:hypothetical protein